MTEKGKQGSTDTTSVAAGRFTVQLSAEVRPALEAIGGAISAAVQSQTGVGVELSMAQVVTALIKARATELAAEAEPSANL